MISDAATPAGVRKKLPVLALLSFLFLVTALVFFALSEWRTGFGFLVFHWLLGLLAMMLRKKHQTQQDVAGSSGKAMR